MPILGYILTAFGAYLLGSIPTGFMLARARGIDIRKVGSGNIGATNVFRILGTVAGVGVLLVDALKGWLAVVVLAPEIGRWLYPGADPLAREWFRVVGGICAILGHNYTCWLRFKGGKGIATSAGTLLALVPWSLLIAFVVWLVIFVLTRYVSLASIAAAFVLPFATWLTGQSTLLIVLTAAMALLAIHKHKSNIQRLLKGTEHKIGARKGTPSESPKPAA